ncbi:hypothetical protein M3I54_35190 [Paraburkholderia sp. CNPSo 3274]|uniref:hypothetical protein n=1 Tax=Paraburkholderia sp. CNPSo 3274 TaxID=2940932 RepID=UPI0020B63ABD|nr:hypothetical protein [Paraburkholderia sp. CNPSo 3274]MCP3712134.1 hypothetical protein [Paraburkholderia sp. CNPSo 3274]
MKNLLTFAIEAHGGLKRWNELSEVSADLDVGARWQELDSREHDSGHSHYRAPAGCSDPRGRQRRCEMPGNRNVHRDPYCVAVFSPRKRPSNLDPATVHMHVTSPTN